MGSSFLSEDCNTSILRTGAPDRHHYPLNYLPASRLLPPRGGLERSDFVLWPAADFRGVCTYVRCSGRCGLVLLGPELFCESDPRQTRRRPFPQIGFDLTRISIRGAPRFWRGRPFQSEGLAR